MKTYIISTIIITVLFISFMIYFYIITKKELQNKELGELKKGYLININGIISIYSEGKFYTTETITKDENIINLQKNFPKRYMIIDDSIILNSPQIEFYLFHNNIRIKLESIKED